MIDMAAISSTLVGVTVLGAITTAVLRGTRIPRPYAPVTAVLRGAIQLALISLVLSSVITDLGWVGLALAVMLTAAVLTTTRRTGWSGRTFLLVAGAMVTGVALTLTVVFVTGAIELSGRYLLSVGGIVIGSSMSIATLAGRRFAESVHDRWDEVEGWLALGARPRQSTLHLAREAVYAALIPTTDQTRTTGLVTLPGAFIGAVFGGASPVDAGQFQILVLAAVLTAGSITAVLLVAGLAQVRTKPERVR